MKAVTRVVQSENLIFQKGIIVQRSSEPIFSDNVIIPYADGTVAIDLGEHASRCPAHRTPCVVDIVIQEHRWKKESAKGARGARRSMMWL